VATRNDATGEPVEFEFNGETYEIPPAEEWDLEVIEAIDAQKMTTALRALIGDEQYERFRASNRKARSLAEFFEAAGKAVNAGN